MEIFVFVHIGGKVSDISILPVMGGEAEEAVSLLDTSLLQDFDARECNCFVVEEKEKILPSIKTAFGGFETINEEAQSLLQRTLDEQKCKTAHDLP